MCMKTIHTRIFLKDSVTVYHYIHERTLSSKILYEIRTTHFCPIILLRRK